MEKYIDKVNWINISTYQKLSFDFIKKYQNKLNFYCILGNKNISIKIKIKIKQQLQ
jgi:hypothetical protein